MVVNPGDLESFIGTYVEALLYGYYLCLTPKVVAIFRQKGYLSGGSHFYVFFTFLALFVLITARCIIDVFRCVAAIKDGSTVDYGRVDAPSAIAANAILFAANAIADTLLVWRTYLVWNKRWKIVLLPTLALTGSTLASAWLVYAQASFDPGEQIFHLLLAPIGSFAYLTLFHNVSCTGLIAYKVLTARQVAFTSMYRSNDPLQRIVSAIVESAALYSCTILAQAVTAATRSYGLYTCFDIMAPIIGIVLSNMLICGSETTQTVVYATRMHDDVEKPGAGVIHVEVMSQTPFDVEAARD